MPEHGDDTDMAPERSVENRLLDPNPEDLAQRPRSKPPSPSHIRTLLRQQSANSRSSLARSSNSDQISPASPNIRFSDIPSPKSLSRRNSGCPESSHAVSSRPLCNSLSQTPFKDVPEATSSSRNLDYKRLDYTEAIRKHPNDPKWRILQAEALLKLGWCEAAYDEFTHAQKLDPENPELHCAMSQFFLRINMLHSAELHKDQCLPEYRRRLSTQIETVKTLLPIAEISREICRWKDALAAVDDAIDAGADLSPSILALRAEMLLKMDELDQAEITISKAVNMKPLQQLPKFLGMEPEAYVCIVFAQIQMAMGKFTNAVAEADNVYTKSNSAEIIAICENIRMVNKARDMGNADYKKGAYLQAYKHYEDGLQRSKSNIVLLSNMAACNFMLERWEECIQICNEVLRIRPNNKKALERRGHSYAQLKKRAESASDYKAAGNISPEYLTLATALVEAETKLAESVVEDLSQMTIGTMITKITTAEQFQETISAPGISIAFFTDFTDPQCIDITPCVEFMCTFYRAINLLQVDIHECPSIANSENMHHVPSFVIYREGQKVKETICPTDMELAAWVDDYMESQIERKN